MVLTPNSIMTCLLIYYMCARQWGVGGWGLEVLACIYTQNKMVSVQFYWEPKVALKKKVP